ncbi:MAG TPA: septation protein IspZ [Caulobacteraceae bacterium]|nr:septation protein IspZ [Caulobacteraceae bacterium]
MAERSTAKWVQPVVDYTGLGLMVVGFIYRRNMMDAAWGLVAGSVIGLIVGLIMQRKIAIMPLVTAVLAVVFAGLTLYFHNTFFLKIKLTIVDTIFAVILLGGVAIGKRPLRALLGAAVHMSDTAWKSLNIRYGLYCVFLAVANAIVALTPSIPDSWWVAFRFPGVPILTVLFSLAQAPFFMRELKEHPEEVTEVPPPPAS